MENNYIQDRPRQLSAPDTSIIKTLTYEEYEALSVADVQDILKVKHIVVTDMPLRQVVSSKGPIAFDEAGIRRLRNLDFPIEIQGMLYRSR